MACFLNNISPTYQAVQARMSLHFDFGISVSKLVYLPDDLVYTLSKQSDPYTYLRDNYPEYFL
jgi:hypothetical protein